MFEAGAELTVEQLEEAASQGKEKVYEFYLVYRRASFSKLTDLRTARAEAKANAASAATEPYNAHSVLFFKEVAKVANQLVQEIKENIAGCDEVMLADANNVLAEAAKNTEGPQKCRNSFAAELDEEPRAPRPG